MGALLSRRAVSYIQRQGLVLAFPIKNDRAETPSLWSLFFPHTKMRWQWDESGDNRLSRLWHFREKLSRSGQVVYSKWYRGRGTFFNFAEFERILACSWNFQQDLRTQLSPDAQRIYEALLDNSPQSPRQLKKSCELNGRFFESVWNRATHELWQKGLMVGWGEIDDGAFPSLALGATERLFEPLWLHAQTLDPREAWDLLHPLARRYARRRDRRNL